MKIRGGQPRGRRLQLGVRGRDGGAISALNINRTGAPMSGSEPLDRAASSLVPPTGGKTRAKDSFDPIRHQLLTGAILLATTIVALFSSGAVLAVCGAALAAVHWLSGRRWARAIEKAREEKRFLDEQLIQSQKLAAIGELSAGIGHEINNPIAIIGQEAEWMRHLLQEEPGKTEEISDSLREIVRQVERCRDITQKLLNFARKMEPVFQGVDVNRLVDDMAKLVEKEAKLRSIRVIRIFQSDLPALFTDPPLLRQVVLNLLNNAMHAVGEKGAITITTSAFGRDFVNIVVSDTGCGIPKENLGRIFDPFFTTKPQGQGTGLGLSMCHGIMDRLGGRISVSSEVGKGSSFSLALPADK